MTNKTIWVIGYWKAGDVVETFNWSVIQNNSFLTINDVI